MNNRITPAEVQAAFEKTGYRPWFGGCARGGGTGTVEACALACMWTANMIEAVPFFHEKMHERIKFSATAKYWFDYTNGFVVGWDTDLGPMKPNWGGDRWRRKGFEDGRAARVGKLNEKDHQFVPSQLRRGSLGAR